MVWIILASMTWQTNTRSLCLNLVPQLANINTFTLLPTPGTVALEPRSLSVDEIFHARDSHVLLVSPPLLCRYPTCNSTSEALREWVIMKLFSEWKAIYCLPWMMNYLILEKSARATPTILQEIKTSVFVHDKPIEYPLEGGLVRWPVPISVSINLLYLPGRHKTWHSCQEWQHQHLSH